MPLKLDNPWSSTTFFSPTPMAASSKTSLQVVTNHPRYQLLGGDLHIIIENIDFCVHRYFFDRESPRFRSMLAGSPSPGKPQEPVNMLRLTEVSAKHFEKFLMVFYNPLYTLYPDTTADDWAVILHLAYDWEFDQVTDLAIRELEKLEMKSVDRIALYQKHGLKLDAPVLVGHYVSLCARGYPLDLAESQKLPLDTVVLVNQVMHALPKTRLGDVASSKAINADLIAKIVNEVTGTTDKQASENLGTSGDSSKSPTPALNGKRIPSLFGESEANGVKSRSNRI
ncbi:hypothetical protein MIND_00946600 [Mycena indigotica]|uniref:BTB domain-containing protein n=1 Tax=Mycena indigotica TaxID=2126181 RepID=A0A8H6VX59_9AGAR|nr:uncharacterized protein MIND_00946600 [Mycena indigotica]KAF7297137.1 hypothetical protein MIND_00946600 [Mycena indigotica]